MKGGNLGMLIEDLPIFYEVELLLYSSLLYSPQL
jgi:hypothetical protein